MFWKIYFWVFAALMTVNYAQGLDLTMKWMVIDLVVSLPSLLALYGYAYRKVFLTVRVWKAYFVFFIVENLLFNLVLSPMEGSQALDMNMLIGLVITLPVFVATFLYAFENRDGMV
jgi:hypothetical protein